MKTPKCNTPSEEIVSGNFLDYGVVLIDLIRLPSLLNYVILHFHYVLYSILVSNMFCADLIGLLICVLFYRLLLLYSLIVDVGPFHSFRSFLFFYSLAMWL